MKRTTQYHATTNEHNNHVHNKMWNKKWPFGVAFWLRHPLMEFLLLWSLEAWRYATYIASNIRITQSYTAHNNTKCSQEICCVPTTITSHHSSQKYVLLMRMALAMKKIARGFCWFPSFLLILSKWRHEKPEKLLVCCKLRREVNLFIELMNYWIRGQFCFILKLHNERYPI